MSNLSARSTVGGVRVQPRAGARAAARVAVVTKAQAQRPILIGLAADSGCGKSTFMRRYERRGARAGVWPVEAGIRQCGVHAPSAARSPLRGAASDRAWPRLRSVTNIFGGSAKPPGADAAARGLTVYPPAGAHATLARGRAQLAATRTPTC